MNQAEALQYATEHAHIAQERNFYRANLTAPDGSVITALGGTPEEACMMLGMNMWVKLNASDPIPNPGPHRVFRGGVWEDCACERASDHAEGL